MYYVYMLLFPLFLMFCFAPGIIHVIVGAMMLMMMMTEYDNNNDIDTLDGH